MSGLENSTSEYSRLLHEYILLPRKIPSGLKISDVNISSPLTKHEKGKEPKFKLNIPILSAAMQSVTGPKMAIAMAQLGGAGVIFCSQEIEQEADMVRKVKEYKAGFVIPDVFSPEDLLEDVKKRIDEKNYSTFPITEDGTPNGKLVGYLTDNDFYFPKHFRMKVKERMIPIEKVSYALLKDVVDEQGVPNLVKANDILMSGHHGSLPIVDENMKLCYVVFRKDIREHLENPLELVDNKKRFICGAAVNTHDYEKRSEALVKADVDFLCIDTSQACSDYVKNCLQYLKSNFPDVPVIAGNVVTADGFKFLVENGADAVKVGMGSGSICITQEQIKVGRGQATAVIEVAETRNKYYEETGVYVPIISDGGIRIAGDITIALALGADSVMVGGYIVGAEESNSNRRVIRTVVDGIPMEEMFKEYWGEGSNRARNWSEKRYEHPASFEEGTETLVRYIGPLKIHMSQALNMIRDGIKKAGCSNIKELHESRWEILSPLSMSTSSEKSSSRSMQSKILN
jgi:IMP dehydrogenase